MYCAKSSSSRDDFGEKPTNVNSVVFSEGTRNLLGEEDKKEEGIEDDLENISTSPSSE
jgi:hypothetical protein